MRARRLLAAAAVACACCARAAAHARWVCPPPRDASLGLKLGPCGGADAATDGATHAPPPLTVQPGPLTVVWEEAVPHAGSPARIALSVDDHGDADNARFARCVVLDHIPHNDAPPRRPLPGLAGSYTRFRLTVNVPDVRCARCTLQLVTLMSDGLHGTPAGARCAMPADGGGGAEGLPPCAAYYSCAPLAINGTKEALDAAACAAQPGWPYAATPHGVYESAADTARWSRDGWLEDAPPAFRAPAGPCARV
jgi:hypothetical protein